MKTASLIRSNGYFINNDGKKTNKITNCIFRGYDFHVRHTDLHIKNAANENMRIRTGEMTFEIGKNGDVNKLVGKSCTITSRYDNKLTGYRTLVTFED